VGAAAADPATLRAYCACFRMMAIAAMAVSPGILLFRGRAAPRTVTGD
jgi:hypothetical protein